MKGEIGRGCGLCGDMVGLGLLGIIFGGVRGRFGGVVYVFVLCMCG